MIHFLAFYVKRLKKAHFKKFYSTKRSTFQNSYANRLKSKNFYSIKSALFRISIYADENTFKGSQPPPPPYRNNLYKITYVINFSRYSLKIRGGGGFNPPYNLSFIVFVYDYDYDYEITLFEHKQNQHIHIIIVQ